MAVERTIAIPIDSILELMKDYTAGEGSIPADAKAVSLMVNPAQRGMFAIVLASEEFKDDTPIRVEFDIKRTYTV